MWDLAQWPWWVWVSVGLCVLAGILAGVLHYRTHHDALLALQVGVERFIGTLASRGMPEQANELGHTIGAEIAKAGPAVRRLNNTLHAKTKAQVAAESLSGKSTRELIMDAFRGQGREAAP